MQLKKTTIAAAAGATIIGLALTAGVASANSATGTSLVDQIAQKFNLNKADVQKVFDDNHTAKQAQQDQNYEARLTQAVKDGKLTEDQKTKLIAKHKELETQMQQQRDTMKADRAAMASKTAAERQALRDQRRTEMEAQRTAIQTWEKDNNIPAGYLMGGPGMGNRGGHGPGLGAPDGQM